MEDKRKEGQKERKAERERKDGEKEGRGKKRDGRERKGKAGCSEQSRENMIMPITNVFS